MNFITIVFQFLNVLYSVSRGDTPQRLVPCALDIPGHFRVPAFLDQHVNSRRKMAVFTFCRNEAYRKPDYGYVLE